MNKPVNCAWPDVKPGNIIHNRGFGKNSCCVVQEVKINESNQIVVTVKWITARNRLPGVITNHNLNDFIDGGYMLTSLNQLVI